MINLNDTQIFVVSVIATLLVFSLILFGVSFKFQNNMTQEGPFSGNFDVQSYA